MATISWTIWNFSGIKSQPIGSCQAKMPFRNHDNHETYRFCKCHHSTSLFNLFSRKIPKTTHIFSSGRNYEMDYDDGAHTEPFWLSLIRESIWAARTLVAFLVEQPSQLKYIEWPSFQITLKTATLTLVLVAALIVALSSVDSALSFLLALLSRRKA
ncbi:hypothetical protein CASFOL_034048 [Castilleja foliolosa]|uniref:Preprotein translocase subunit SecE n=1 Tax=Castilleja foliolosa TaxID=1961234 RepID=A0ABD3C1B2_9LAMI